MVTPNPIIILPPEGPMFVGGPFGCHEELNHFELGFLLCMIVCIFVGTVGVVEGEIGVAVEGEVGVAVVGFVVVVAVGVVVGLIVAVVLVGVGVG